MGSALAVQKVSALREYLQRETFIPQEVITVSGPDLYKCKDIEVTMRF